MEITYVKRPVSLYVVLVLASLSLLRTGFVDCATGVILPFGTGEGDIFLHKADEYTHEEIHLDRTFTFLDTNYQSLFININGVISFTNPLPNFSTDTLPVPSTPFVAPYWADVDTRDFGAISFRQLSWEGSDDTILDRVNNIVRAAFVDQQYFSASWILMVSWNKVGFNSQIDATRVNTFQCILVAGGQFSGVIFHYDTLLWTSDIFHGGNQFTGLGGIPAQIGFNAGDGLHAYSVHTSQTEEAINMTMQSNVNVPGRFVYRVDFPEIKDPACQDKGDVQLFPAIDTMFGGNKIFIQGPCYDLVTSHVVCKFENQLSRGTVESPLRAFCVSPTMFTDGDVTVQVSLDGGATFPYTGYLQVELPTTSPMVFKVKENEWLTSSALELMWDIHVLEGVDTVNINVYSYWESQGQMHWDIAETLARGVTYSDGGLNVVKSQIREVAGDGSDLMGVIGVIEDVAETDNRIPKAIWSDVDSLQWLFSQNSSSWCTEWIKTNDVLNESYHKTRTAACPCVLREAKRDIGRYQPRQDCRDNDWGRFPQNCEDRPGAFHCVITRTTRQNGVGEECCYDTSGILIEERFAPSGFGLTSHPHHHTSATVDDVALSVPYFSHFYHDIIPEMQCCKFSSFAESGSDSSCSRFMTSRRSQSCRFYQVPKPASLFGASHISTFDGLEFTFPAKGEYILLQTTDFLIQGRLEPIDTGDGATSSVMTAIAIKQRDSDVIHIQSSARLHVDVLVCRENEIFTLIDPVQSHSWSFKGVEVFYSDSRDAVELYFEQGVGVLIHATGKSLRCIIIVPPEYQNRTDGLLGSWNGNKEDDLRLDDGSILSHDSFGEDIVNSFGAKWLIQDDNSSLFYYLPGYSRDIYLNAHQPPISFDPEPEIDPSTICYHNTLCALDLAISLNNEDFALATLNAQSELRTTRRDLEEVDKSFLLCPDVIAPQNGNIQYSSGRYVGDNVTFSCADCYELVGNSTLLCDYDLRWSNDGPVCHREVNTTCSIPETLNNGIFHVEDCNRSITFSCHEGFDLIGQEVITCHNDSWDQDAPTCTVHVETTASDTTAVSTQTPGFLETQQPSETTESRESDVKTNCSTPEPPVNGTLEMASYNSTAVYHCDQGFTLIGQAEITCHNGSWSNEAPSCVLEEILETSIALEYKAYSGFMLWWIFVLFVSVTIIALIVVVVFLCYILKATSEKQGDAPTGQQYQQVANT